MQAQRAEVEAIAAQRRAAPTSTTPSPRSIAAAACCRASRPRSTRWPRRTPRPRSRPCSASWPAPMAAHDSAVMMHAGLFARLDAVHAARHDLGLDARVAAPGRAPARRLRARRRAAGPGQAAALRADHGAPRAAHHALRAERAGRRGRLPAGAVRRRSRRPAALRARVGAPGGHRSRAGRGHARGDAVALADRAVPHVLDAARAARDARGGPGWAAARTRARPTTTRWRATSCACARSRPGCTATRATPSTRWPTPWPATSRRSTTCWTTSTRARSPRCRTSARPCTRACATPAWPRPTWPGTGASAPSACARRATRSTTAR